jgi:hypothetical protein
MRDEKMWEFKSHGTCRCNNDGPVYGGGDTSIYTKVRNR